MIIQDLQVRTNWSTDEIIESVFQRSIAPSVDAGGETIASRSIDSETAMPNDRDNIETHPTRYVEFFLEDVTNGVLCETADYDDAVKEFLNTGCSGKDVEFGLQYECWRCLASFKTERDLFRHFQHVVHAIRICPICNAACGIRKSDDTKQGHFEKKHLRGRRGDDENVQHYRRNQGRESDKFTPQDVVDHAFDNSRVFHIRGIWLCVYCGDDTSQNPDQLHKHLSQNHFKPFYQEFRKIYTNRIGNLNPALGEKERERKEEQICSQVKAELKHNLQSKFAARKDCFNVDDDQGLLLKYVPASRPRFNDAFMQDIGRFTEGAGQHFSIPQLD